MHCPLKPMTAANAELCEGRCLQARSGRLPTQFCLVRHSHNEHCDVHHA